MFAFFLNHIPRPWLIKLSYLLRPILVYWFRGDRYQDPIDGRGYRRFLPYGYENKRKNVLAPGSLSLERHRLLWLYLKNETDFFSRPKPVKVLHFAPEQAFHKKFKNLSNWDYVTTDIESPLADVKADICHLPFENNSFDLILCSHVLEHISDDEKALAELFRVMKPGGTGFFQIPMDVNRPKTYEDATILTAEGRREAFGQYDHVRIYGLDFADRLKHAGFETELVRYAERLGPELTDKYRLDASEFLPIGKKPYSIR